MIAALLALLIALAIIITLPSPLCLLALVPWGFGGWLFIQSARGRWNR